MRKRNERYFILIVIIVSLVLFFYGRYRKYVIDKDYVYVIAKVYNIESNAENINFCFKYLYKKKSYDHCISTLDPTHQDFYIWLKISTSNPNLYEVVRDRIPEPLIKKVNMDTSWTNLPH